MAIRLIKFTTLLKKLFSIFLIFNLTFVSTAQAAGVFVDSFSVNSEDTEARGLTFNNDGTKMFVAGYTNDDVYEYTLSTGFDVSTASFVVAFSIDTDSEDDVRDVKFNSNGTKMFVLGRDGDKVYEHTLTTGFNISTSSFVVSFDISSEEGAATSIEFNTEGTKMFVLGQSTDYVFEYTLGTGFDVSTATYAGNDKRFYVGNEEADGNGLAFNKSGTKMFVIGHNGDDVNEYTLTTAFDVSTASFVDRFSVSSEDTWPAAVAFNNDGTKMFVLGKTGDDVNEYTLSCAYKVTSSSTCDDPTTIKDVVGSIEAQIEAAKRFIKQSSGSVLKRLTFIRSHKKDGSLWSSIGNSQDFNVNFSNKALDQLTNLAPKLSIYPLQKILPKDWALWSEGSVSFGKIGETGLSSAQDIRALGITIGADKKIDDNKVSRFFNTLYGVALRLGHDEVDIGTYGSNVDTHAISLSIYGTRYLDESRFIDGVIGASHLKTDLVRKNSGNTDTNNGERKGKQVFGFINFGREFEHNEFNITPTSRIDASYTRLEGYTESGTEGLKYNDQEINSLVGSLGVMIDRDYIWETSILKQKANFEYSKDVISVFDNLSPKADSHYVSDNSKIYTYYSEENTQDTFKGSIGFDFTNQQGFTLSGEFEKKLIINEGHINTIFFTASYLSRKETEYLLAFNGDDELLGSSIKIAKTLGPFNLGLQLENDLFSQKNNNLNLSLGALF